MVFIHELNDLGVACWIYISFNKATRRVFTRSFVVILNSLPFCKTRGIRLKCFCINFEKIISLFLIKKMQFVCFFIFWTVFFFILLVFKCWVCINLDFYICIVLQSDCFGLCTIGWMCIYMTIL